LIKRQDRDRLQTYPINVDFVRDDELLFGFIVADSILYFRESNKDG
jgi:hypothetical protein